LLFEAQNSLINQSLACQRGSVATNGDGFGVGWYGTQDKPGLYRDIRPAWNDDNLRSLAEQIEARLFFAHVRASTGTPTTRQNCHPFRHGNWLFMHNGRIGGYDKVRRDLEFRIAPHLYNDRIGTTDSEIIFLLLLGNGHCFRDHVLEVCPEFARFSSTAEGIRKSFEGSSLETIKHMVAAGMGVTLLPRLSVPQGALQESAAPGRGRRSKGTAAGQEPRSFVSYLPFEGHVPSRRVVLAWRRSFTRYEAIAALRNSIYACELPGVTRLS
jgi:hypothetical protein